MLVEKSLVTCQSSDGIVDECPVGARDTKTNVISSEKVCDVQISHENSNLVNKNDDHIGSTSHTDIGSSVIEMETPMVSEMQFESSKHSEQVVKHADDVTVLEQTRTTVGEDCGVISVDTKHGNDAAGVHNEYSSDAAYVVPPRQAGSADFSGEVLSSMLVDVHDYVQVVSIQEKGGEEMTSDSGKMDHDSVESFDDGKVVGSSPLAETGENVETASRTEIDASVTKEKGISPKKWLLCLFLDFNSILSLIFSHPLQIQNVRWKVQTKYHLTQLWVFPCVVLLLLLKLLIRVWSRRVINLKGKEGCKWKPQ